MDQLEAYRVLRLEPGCGKEELRAAYAQLSKEFHPEEHPEEFQRIHEAYTTLSRTARRGNVRAQTQPEPQVQPESRTQTKVECIQEELTHRREEPVRTEQKQQYDWKKLEQDTERGERQPEPAQEQYQFDEVLQKAQEKEANDRHELTLRALAEMEILLSAQYMNKLKLFRAFFAKEEYQSILKEPEFMKHFAMKLEGTKLKGVIYDYFIDYYRLRGLNPGNLIPEAASLYSVLDRKRGMNAKAKGNMSYAVPVGLVVGLRAGLRGTDMKTAFGVLILIVVLAMAMIWLYRKLYENHSSIFAQAVLAGLIFVTQLVAMFGDLYAPLLHNDGGILLAFFFWAVSCIWLAVLGIVAVIRKIRRSR